MPESQTTLAEARALAELNEPLPEAFYIDRDGEVQFKPGPLAAARSEWFRTLSGFLALAGRVAPDETCANFARNLWDQTAEFTDGP